MYSYVLLAGGSHVLDMFQWKCKKADKGCSFACWTLFQIEEARPASARAISNQPEVWSHQQTYFNNSSEIYGQETMFGKAPERSRRPTFHAKSSKQYPTSEGQQQQQQQ
ncbi:hypothetical protein ONS95_000816 [Cadophora gregata]|uniref:uncharacterized protein n=1 Tax=Cadophora gregata TaxID=51156 RepID=UPI0026DC8CFE|nr:uncharacterized protein ONS95_000816 [Cadophora gregata]KAK0103000.1 hypothetical protein ONS96_005613 [Cadophora gregata f. sp. sojae]KAK0128868.1 hypothetical protein ONS95_000816 [Cadophora gregata]